MTVATSTSKSGPYAGAGTTGPFTVTFRFLENSHLQVIKTSTAGVDSTLALTTDYAVSGAGASTGTVTLVSALLSGEKLTIIRNVPFTQEADYVQNDAFPAESHERALDKLTMETQQLKEQVDRALVLPATVAGVSTTLPTPAGNNLVGWNETGTGLQNFDASVFATIVAYGTARSEIFTGTGVQVAFVLTNNPGALNNLDIAIGGVVQLPGVDYTWSSGTTVTFTTAPPLGATVLIRYMQALALGTADAGSVQYIPAGTGAVATTVQEVLRETVSVKRFGAVGDGAANDTAAIQAAINSGNDLFFPAGTYLANNLTQSKNFQRFYAHGQVNISKNANGVLLASTGNYVEVNGIQFVGTGYTGDNVTATGSNPRFINCASYGAAGRALKATGGHVQIIGTCGIYATTDATATGYDIEIGVSGTATLYHQLVGIYTSQSTGGILLVDTGTHVITGGQFGKLTIQSGTSPAGSNGGMTFGTRILGDVSVGLSSAVFSSNQFSGVAITFAAGTGGCRLDASNVYGSGATVVNNGNANNLIEREVSTGSVMRIRWGSDTSYRQLTMDGGSAGEGWQFDGSTVLPHGQSYKVVSADGATKFALVGMGGANNNITLGATTAGFTNVASGAGGVYIVVDGPSRFQVTTSAFRPIADGSYNLGGASNRFSTVYATTGTINTSDEREKQDILWLDAAEKRVAIALKGLVKKFRFKDAVQIKGDAARIHMGVIAQDVKAAFEAEGLDAMRYAILCFDKWDAEPEVKDEDGNVISPARETGDRYGVRYEELLAFIISAL